MPTQCEPEKIKILLVDDRKENLLALEATLASPNYELIQLQSGSEALRYLLHSDAALILMDVQMPELDGFETATTIKRNERTREIPIIFITAINKDEYYIDKGYKHGAVDYIYKPYDGHILKAKVAVFAELYQKNQRLLLTEKKLRENERKEREQKILELELKSLRREQVQQKKYRDLVEGINHGFVWSAAPDTLVFSFVSKTAEKILGYPIEQCSEELHFLMNHLYPEDRAPFKEAVQKAIESNADIEVEHRFIKKNNDIVWLNTGIRAVLSDEKKALELRCLSVEITKLKEAEKILQTNKLRSDFLAQASLHLVESFDYEKNLQRVGSYLVSKFCDAFSIATFEENGSIKNLTTISADQSKNKALQIFTEFCLLHSTNSGESKRYPVVVDSFFRESMQEKQTAAFRELGLTSLITVPLCLREKNFGIALFASTTAGHYFDKDDLSLAEDLAYRVSSAIENSNLYKKSQAAISIRDEFLSIASHELKTPLTPLKIQIQSLLRALSMNKILEINSEKISKMLTISNRQIEKMSRLIDDLLDLSQISVGKLRAIPEEFNLSALIEDVVSRFSSQLKLVNCTVELDLPKEISVYWDRFRIEQVIANLLSNAIKYAPGKPIEISLWADAGLVKFAFQDHGIGIAKEDQARIFNRFERAVSGSHFGGLGLGLFIISQILEAHGGKISVKSEIGQGATFMVEIPQRLPQIRQHTLPEKEVEIMLHAK